MDYDIEIISRFPEEHGLISSRYEYLEIYDTPLHEVVKEFFPNSYEHWNTTIVNKYGVGEYGIIIKKIDTEEEVASYYVYEHYGLNKLYGKCVYYIEYNIEGMIAQDIYVDGEHYEFSFDRLKKELRFKFILNEFKKMDKKRQELNKELLELQKELYHG